MMKILLNCFKNMNNKVFKFVNLGFAFSFIFCLIGILLVLIYNTYPSSYDFYKGGLILFKTGVSFVSMFLSCGIVFDKLRNDL